MQRCQFTAACRLRELSEVQRASKGFKSIWQHKFIAGLALITGNQAAVPGNACTVCAASTGLNTVSKARSHTITILNVYYLTLGGLAGLVRLQNKRKRLSRRQRAFELS